MALGLEGKVALVTGSSRGIGFAVAQELAQLGANCVVTSRTRDGAEEAVKSLSSGVSGTHVPVAMDTSDGESVLAAVSEARAEIGDIDILVNNAGRLGGGPDTFDSVSEELLLSDFQTKVMGYLRTIRAVVGPMSEKGWGRIINISGLAAREAKFVSGGARNAAIVALTKTLSWDLGLKGITVNAIYPNRVLTQAIIDRRAEEAQARGITLDERLAELGKENAIGRLVTPEEVAYLVAFLASPRAGAITGEVIAVTGGRGHAVYY